MIKVVLPSQTLGISFRHSNVAVPHPGPGYKGKVTHTITLQTKATYCSVFLCMGEDDRTGKWLADGVAIVGLGDSFNKAKGRRIALTRALETMKLGKADRIKVWDAYNLRGVVDGSKVSV